MLKKFIGPEASTIVISGESYGVVEPGESIAVPDEIANRVKWPETLWADAAPKVSKKPATKSEIGE